MIIKTDSDNYSIARNNLEFIQNSEMLFPYMCEKNEKHGKLSIKTKSEKLMMFCHHCGYETDEMPGEIVDGYLMYKVKDAEAKRNIFLEEKQLPLIREIQVGDVVQLIGKREAEIIGIGTDAYFIQTSDGCGPTIIFEQDIIQIKTKK